MSHIESSVIGFVARQRGVSAESVQLETRLLQDLGLDGDDALEFMEEFGREFGVDLARLEGRLSRHFGGEAEGTLAFAIPAALVAGLAYLLSRSNMILPPLAWMAAALPAVALALFLHWRRRRSRHVITVADLVNAASAGRWVGAPQRPTGP